MLKRIYSFISPSPKDEEPAIRDSELDSSDEDGNFQQLQEPQEVDVIEPPSNCKRFTYRLITNGAAYISNICQGGFFAYSMQFAIKEIFSKWDYDIDSYNPLVIGIVSLLALASTICDASMGNPPEMADLLSIPNSSKMSQKYLQNVSLLGKRFSTIFKYINLASLSYYIIFNVCSDVLSIAYTTKNRTVIFSLGIPLVFLSSGFVYILLNTRIREHTYYFTSKLFNPNESMFLTVIKSPLKSFEVTLQTVSSAMNRGIGNGNIVNQTLIYIFFMNSNLTTSRLTYSGIFFGAYISIISRTLNVINQFYNQKFAEINNEDLKNTKVSKVWLTVDVIMTLLRAFPAGILIYQYTDNNYKLPMGLPLGILIGVHNIYVRYENRRYQTALDNLHIQNRSTVTDKALTDLSKEELFDAISETFKTQRLKNVARFFNICGRACSSLSFLGFLLSLNKGLNINANLLTIICVHQLWGNITLENDYSFYQDNLINVWAYDSAKMYMEKTRPQFGRIFSFFWKSKKDYPVEYLRDFHSSLVPSVT